MLIGNHVDIHVGKHCKIIKREFKQWLSTIPPVSTKWTSTSHINSLNTKRPQHMTLEIHALALARHNHVAKWNRLMGSRFSPFHHWISNIYKQTIKRLQICFNSKRPLLLPRMEDNIDMNMCIYLCFIIRTN